MNDMSGRFTFEMMQSEDGVLYVMMEPGTFAQVED